MVECSEQSVSSSGGHCVTLVGVGAIGSQIASQLARSDGLCRVTVVDPDDYEPPNRTCQQVDAAEVGRPKAQVQATRMRRINPALLVTPFVAAVQDIPLGRLRADVLIAGLDSRRARMAVNEIAWRFGVPWIDAGVSAADSLVRVAVYRPGAGQPCLECAWGDDDYAAVERVFPCAGGREDSAPTRAPVHLGALAAALQMGECRKLLRGDNRHALVGKQLYVDARRHAMQVTSLTRRAGCRFDHRQWSIEASPWRKPPEKITLGDLFEWSGRPATSVAHAAGGTPGPGNADSVSLSATGHGFVRLLYCPACGTALPRRVYLAGRVPRRIVCHVCRGPLVVRGVDQFFELTAAATSLRERQRSLRAIGFRTGDVIRVHSGSGDRYVEL